MNTNRKPPVVVTISQIVLVLIALMSLWSAYGGMSEWSDPAIVEVMGSKMFGVMIVLHTLTFILCGAALWAMTARWQNARWMAIGTFLFFAAVQITGTIWFLQVPELYEMPDIGILYVITAIVVVPVVGAPLILAALLLFLPSVKRYFSDGEAELSPAEPPGIEHYADEIKGE